VKILAPVLVLAFATSALAQSTTTEIRVTGEHRTAGGDTPDSARQLALVDARWKAWQAALTRLQSRADVEALQLKPLQVEAFTAILLQIDDPADGATPATAGALVRVPMRARVDAAGAARQMAALRRDQDVTSALIQTWTEMQRLHGNLADQTRRRPGATSNEAGAIVQDQLQIVTALDLKYLVARATAAMARTQPSTVGGGVPTEEGRALARQLAEQALALAPDSPDGHYLMGDLLIDDEQPQAAEAEYRKALSAHADSSPGHAKLAEALRLQGNFPEAIAELREALRIDPGSARAHTDLGLVLRAQGKLPEAVAAYREAIRLDPDWIDAHNGLAVAFANQKRLDDAVAEFREIVRIDPESTIGYYNLAYALADLDRDVESAAALREVVRINPNHYNARFNLGELFRLEAKYDEAVKQFREYLRLAPDTPQNRRNITRAQGYVKQYED
jgi:tetratricopeptide (TPR) repeat protein